MNILKQLSIKNLKLNKKRTISTSIGIILSVALICAVSCMVSSFKTTLVENAVDEYGYYHIKLSDVSESDVKEIKNNRDIKDIYETSTLGWAKLKNSKNAYKPYLQVFSMSSEDFENLKFKLIEGRFAENSDEIVISKHIKANGKVDLKVGDSITLDIGKRMIEDDELNRNNPYIYEENETERLEVNMKKTFKIVGIIERPNKNFEEFSSPGYTVITTNMNSDKKDVYLSFKNVIDYKSSMQELLGTDDYEKIENHNTEGFKYENYRRNNELLRWEVFAFSDTTVKMLYAVAGVVIFIIIFTSVFCIRNSFAISITEKMKMYGMLSSVGATKKQIKKNVIFEALILGLIGIPIGIISGLLAVFILLKIVNAMIGEYLFSSGNGIVFSVSIVSIVIAIILGLITIYLSAYFSARKASKVSPIDNLRNSNEIKINKKELKTPKIISKIFKTGGIIAYKNLKRSKKKYKTTVISIAVSIAIFVSMNAFVTSMFGVTEDYYKDFDYNMQLNMRGLSKDEVNRVLALDNIEEKYRTFSASTVLFITNLDKINYNDYLGINNFYEKEENGVITYVPGKGEYLEIVGLDDETFKKYCDKIGEDYNKVKDKAILFDKVSYYDEEAKNTKEIRRYKYNKNEIIEADSIQDEQKIKFTVGAITDINPYGFELSNNSGGYLILNTEENKNIKFHENYTCIESKNADQLQEDIEALGIDDIGIFNMEEDVKAQKSVILVIKIFLYGFITIITLIGVTNIFNTITSNMELRQKEFAMLKSIGMTKKEFKRMINLETIFYGVKSWIYGTVLGLLGTFAIYKAFSVKIERGVYIPIMPIILSAIFVFVFIFIIMRYSISKINKQNTIETIRKDNI